VSGDPIPTSIVKILIRPSETFARNASQYSSEINKTYITNASGELSWDRGVASFAPGDVYLVRQENLSHLQNIADINLWFNQSFHPDNRGKTFFLEFYYKNNMISRNEVLIEG
jgi:hypothetical protein